MNQYALLSWIMDIYKKLHFRVLSILAFLEKNLDRTTDMVDFPSHLFCFSRHILALCTLYYA